MLWGTALWSGNFIVARGLNDLIPPVSLAFYRWLTAVLVFAPFAIRGCVKDWPKVTEHIGYMAVTAFIGVTCFNTFIYIAGHTTTAMNLSLIAITFPVFVVLISRVLFKEVLTVKRTAGILIVLTGVVCLITRGELARLLAIRFVAGDLWMLASAVLFAVFSILIKHKPEGIRLYTFQFTLFFMGLVFLLPFFIWEQSRIPGLFLNQTTLPAVLYVGIFASLCAFVLWNRAIIILGPSRAGMIYYTLPLFSGLLAYLFLGEHIGVVHAVSAVLILTGIILANQAT
ncbi:MAG: DMT family transporter [Desulfobacteraceae bacterium]|nr:DMT family transporter [Desulfobacteraceae bacterium]